MGLVDAVFLSILGMAACTSAASVGAAAAEPVCEGSCQANDDAVLLQSFRAQSFRQQSALLPVAGSTQQLKTGKGGWLDAHQHLGAGANWIAQVMCLPDVQRRMEQLFETQVWKAGLNEASGMPGFVEHRPINEGMAVDDLYLYSILARQRIGELEVSTIHAKGFAEAVDSCRVDLEDLGATYLLGKGLNNSITSSGDNDRVVRTGSGTVYPLLLCLEGAQHDADSSDKVMLRRRLLRTLLSSSPLHDFDSAYVMRKVLYGNNYTLRIRYEVQEAIDAGIVESEIFGVDIDPFDPDVTAAYGSKNGMDQVRARWYFATVGCNFAQSGGSTQIQEWSQEAGRMVVRDVGQNEYSCYNNTDKLLRGLSDPQIVGMDSLAPEQFVFSRKEGGALLVRATRAMLAGAKKNNHRMIVHMHVGEGSPIFDFETLFVNGTRLPMKPLEPVPGGMPTELPALKAALYGMRPDIFSGICAAAKEERLLDPEFLPVKRVTELGAASCPPEFPPGSPPWLRAAKDGQTRCNPDEPAHYETARMNLDTLLQIIDEDILAKPEFRDLGKFVKFRFGHVPHATPLQAQWMKKLGITVDVNLESNIMTGSIDTMIPTAAGAAFGLKPGILNTNQWAGLADLKARPQALIYMFRAHSVLSVVLSGVDFLIGTDGAGVEKSDMVGAFGAIDTMLEYYNKMGPVPVQWFAHKATPMEKLAHRWANQLYSVFGHWAGTRCEETALKNQKAFADWMNEKPA